MAIKIALYSLDILHYACSELRLIMPLKKLRDSINFKWLVQYSNQISKINTNGIEWADIIVVQRYFPLHETRPILDCMLSSGKPVCYEIDDFLLDIPRTHPLFHNFQRTAPFIREFLPKVDLVTVTTEALRERIAPYNPNTVTIPNFIDESAIAQPSSAESSAQTVIAYMGSPTHGQDLELVEDVLFKIRDKFGPSVAFTFWGCAGTRLAQLGRVISFDDRYVSFLKTLGQVHFDIGLAPLVDNAFNRCKSNIKWLEYSAYGRAGVYSDLEPYRDSVEHGKTGMLAGNDPREWFNALEFLITHPAERKAMGRAARKEAFARFGLSKGAQRYLDVYKSLLNR